MSIYDVPFAVYERLASAKMTAFKSAINAHTHDGSSGVQIPFSLLDGYLSITQIINGSITGAKLESGCIDATKIGSKIIDMTKIDNDISHPASLKLDDTGYALYSP